MHYRRLYHARQYSGLEPASTKALAAPHSFISLVFGQYSLTSNNSTFRFATLTRTGVEGVEARGRWSVQVQT